MIARPVLVALLVLACATPALAQTPDIAFGRNHVVALRNNGEVMTWGDNVMCQLGRPGGNSSATPGLALRNGAAIAAASEHSLALTADGKVYGWGSNPEGALGMGNTFDQCEGPALVPSLADKTIAKIATGHGFSVALTSTGDLYCSGDSSMGQCPGTRGRSEVFVPVAIPELAGQVVAIEAGGFHTLALTRDGRLYAFGRGRDGQLGNGRTVNGAGFVMELRDVVSFSAGTWHSVAATADGSVWTWGNNLKSQLCDGTVVNKPSPTRVTLPAGSRVASVAAGGHSTMLRAADGTLHGCGDNQFGTLGIGAPLLASQPTAVPGTTSSPVLALGGANGAVSPDGCAVRLSGDNGSGIVGAASRVFVVRGNLSLCAPRSATPMANLLREPVRGGAAGCWTPQKDEDTAASAQFAPFRAGMLAAEGLLKKNAAFTAPLEPVRFRASMSAGPGPAGGASLHVKVVPERKLDGTRLWTGTCDVIPQLDRIGGGIFQVSVFFNEPAVDAFIGPSGQPPKLTGQVGGYPEYDGWVVITKDGRLPWTSVTLAEKLDAEGVRRRRALEDWNRTRTSMKVPDEAALLKTYESLKASDPAGAEKFLASGRAQIVELKRLQAEVYPRTTATLEKQVADLDKYRASFTAEELRAPAVRGDPTGAGRRGLDAEIASLRKSAPADERESLIADAAAQYDLRNIRPGTADQAISVKPDPTFPGPAGAGRIQVISVLFSLDPNAKNEARRAWQQQVKASFDFAALASLLK